MASAADELEAIRHTLAAYNIAGDRMRIEALADTFTEDGVLETPTFRMEGRAAILAGLGGANRGRPAPTPGERRPSFVRHNLTTSKLELTGAETAEGRSYFIVFTDIGPDHMGCYVDRFRKVEGRWLLADRRVLIDWLSEETLFSHLLESHRARLTARHAG
jgi:hypothetical protein